MPRRTGLVAWLAAFVLACSPAPTGSPPAGTGPPSSEPSSSAALVRPSARPSDSTSSAPVVTAVASAAIASPAATPILAPVLSSEEEELTHWLREDARVDCRPRRSDLPDLALFGAECFPSHDLVARVGIYGFDDRQAAAAAYVERMSSAGVEPYTGSCVEGIPGDEGWANEGGHGARIDETNAMVVDGQVIGLNRAGCFHGEDGTANWRATCWPGPTDGVYVGVLGRTQDIGALQEWAWDYPDDIEAASPGPPGICPYEPGLGELEVPLSPGDTP
jgi:hypothetical protein